MSDRRAKRKGVYMQLGYQSIKDSFGSLSRSFVAEISMNFALSTFIETGTFKGDTIASLCQDFDKLISIELSEDLHEQARRRFASCPNVTLIKGNCASQLPRALDKCDGCGAFIWLDAHYSGGGTAKGARNTPIVQEVESIHRCGTGRDVIVIDDLRLFWEVRSGFLKTYSPSVAIHLPMSWPICSINQTANMTFSFCSMHCWSFQRPIEIHTR